MTPAASSVRDPLVPLAPQLVVLWRDKLSYWVLKGEESLAQLRSNEGHTALMIAAAKGHTEIVTLLKALEKQEAQI
jgi:hypothetical protein